MICVHDHIDEVLIPVLAAPTHIKRNILVPGRSMTACWIKLTRFAGTTGICGVILISPPRTIVVLYAIRQKLYGASCVSAFRFRMTTLRCIRFRNHYCTVKQFNFSILYILGHFVTVLRLLVVVVETSKQEKGVSRGTISNLSSNISVPSPPLERRKDWKHLMWIIASGRRCLVRWWYLLLGFERGYGSF